MAAGFRFMLKRLVLPRSLSDRAIVRALALAGICGCLPAEHAGAQPADAQDMQVRTHMLALLHENTPAQQKAIQWLGKLDDIAVLPALLDAYYYVKVPRDDWVWAVGQLTGKSFGRDWWRWMEWLGTQEYTPHPAYALFKQKLFERIDPRIGALMDPGHPRRIRLDEIIWGGVRKDGIPALDSPRMIPAADATYLDDDDPVFGISIGDERQAYPLRILNWHEMLNTTADGRPITLTYCTLCGAAVLYETSVGDTVFDFGSSGLLYRSNKLMYDRQTNTLWSSLHGEPVLGPLAESGIQLRRGYVVRTRWKEWRQRHPQTVVLDPDTGFDRDYSPGAVYADYFKSSKTMFPVAWRDKRLSAKDWVFGMIIDGQPKAWALKKLKKKRLLQDRIGNRPVLLVSDATRLTVRAYETEERFRPAETPDMLRDAEGRLWHVREEALVREDRQVQAPRLPGHLAYWFGWYAFFPNTELWKK